MGNGTASDVSAEVALQRPRKLGDIVLDQVRELITGKRLPLGSG